jgi:hypothetical protein
MVDKHLRHIPTGIVYIWQPAFAQRDDFEDVLPEPEAAEAPKGLKRRAKPTPVVDAVDAEAVSADATRNLPSFLTTPGL